MGKVTCPRAQDTVCLPLFSEFPSRSVLEVGWGGGCWGGGAAGREVAGRAKAELWLPGRPGSL